MVVLSAKTAGRAAPAPSRIGHNFLKGRPGNAVNGLPAAAGYDFRALLASLETY